MREPYHYKIKKIIISKLNNGKNICENVKSNQRTSLMNQNTLKNQ